MEMGKCYGQRHVVTAADATATTVSFNVTELAAKGALVTIRTAAGALKAWDGVITVTQDKVTVDNVGVTDWVATDTIDIVIF